MIEKEKPAIAVNKENEKTTVMPYIHHFPERLHMIGKRVQVRVVFSAPEKQ
ncbi:hypothetical protein V5799_004831, partial [Amblyomma americanum]